MYFSTVVALAALPFLAGAVPVSPVSSRTGSLISVPLSKRSNHLNNDGFVNIENLQASIHHSMARIDQALSAYERNTGEPHPLALKRGHSNERRIIVPVPLTKKFYHFNAIWTGNIRVGTPARAYSVVFDLFTADMFLSGRSCSNCGGHNLYNISASSSVTSYDSTTSTVYFQFGHPVVGNVVGDHVFVAGYEVVNQKILVATNIDPFFQSPDFPADGILGLGLRQSSAFKHLSFFETLDSSGYSGEHTYRKPVFAFYLAGSGPEFIIGGTDRSKFLGDLTYINVALRGFWMVPLDSILVNGKSIPTSLIIEYMAIFDSAGTFVSSDYDTISYIYSNIPGSESVPTYNSGQWTVPCDTNVTVTITLGGTAFNIPPSAYNLGRVPGPNQKNVCMGGFASNGDHSLTLGTVFMQNFYTEFDLAKFRVGIAPIAY